MNDESPRAVLPTSELRKRLRQVLDHLHQSGEPVVVGHYRQPTAVLARFDDYSALVEQASGLYPHISQRADIGGGEPLVRGTRILVREIVQRTRAGQTVDETLAALPHLSAAEVHAALAYYYDHRAEMDERIDAARPGAVLAAHGLIPREIAEGVVVIEPSTNR